VLHFLRQRLQESAEREAAGESLWTPAFSDRVRTRIIHVFRRLVSGAINVGLPVIFAEAQRVILEQEGGFSLIPGETTPTDDFFKYYQRCTDAMFPTAIEALAAALDAGDRAEARANYHSWPYGWAEAFTGEVNVIFAQERVGWELIDGRMVEIHSKELHVAAIEPALRLLHRSEYAKADKQYRDALDELAQGKASDAITDAGATLQEMLEALGCEGNQLGDLARSARKKGLLGAHDSPLVEAIEKTMHWVAADRSEMGDAHHATQATREDAWLIVHVVGALIVRLASGQERRK
jgi:hypothetical protein